MNITIKSIPHAKHRYPTVGDWWFEDGGETLQIRVSQELPQKSQDLVVLHELAEVFMCRANGVGQLEVDQETPASPAIRRTRRIFSSTKLQR
jgi:hypothetical protein